MAQINGQNFYIVELD